MRHGRATSRTGLSRNPRSQFLYVLTEEDTVVNALSYKAKDNVVLRGNVPLYIVYLPTQMLTLISSRPITIADLKRVFADFESDLLEEIIMDARLEGVRERF